MPDRPTSSVRAVQYCLELENRNHCKLLSDSTDSPHDNV